MLKYADISGCEKKQFILFLSEHAEPYVVRQLFLEESQRAFSKVAFLSQQDRNACTCRQKFLKLPIFSLRTRIFTWDALPVEYDIMI